MSGVQRAPSPVLARVVVVAAAVEIDCVVEGARRNPFEFFWWVGLFGLCSLSSQWDIERTTEQLGARMEEGCMEREDLYRYLGCCLGVSADLVYELRGCVWTVG